MFSYVRDGSCKKCSVVITNTIDIERVSHSFIFLSYSLIGILGSDSGLQHSLMMKNEQASSLSNEEYAFILFLFLSYFHLTFIISPHFI